MGITEAYEPLQTNPGVIVLLDLNSTLTFFPEYKVTTVSIDLPFTYHFSGQESCEPCKEKNYSWKEESQKIIFKVYKEGNFRLENY